MKKKITAGVLLILLLAGVCIQPAYANSAQRHWRGTDGTGAVVTGEDCPIVVDKELLTFDVQEFPEQYYPDTDSFLAYTGKVTAEYIFRNPANYAVTATLVFPFGNLPHYGEYIYDRATGRPVDVSDTLKYGVKNQFIRARVAGWEKDCIRRKADAAHMTESEFVRRAAMDREVTVIEGMDELLRELRYQGNNLNQLTVMARQGRITQVNYEPFTEVYRNAWQTLNSLLSHAV